MKRFPIIGIILLIPAFMLMGMLGCTPPKTDTPKPGGDGSKGKKPGEAKAIEGAPDGTFKGLVKFKGTAPAETPEKRILEHKDKDVCLKGGGKNIVEQLWLVKDGLVENVVISLEPGEGKKFKDDEKIKKVFEKKKAIFDQPFCAYIPHVIAVYADVQPVVFKNEASIPHNVKISGGTTNGIKDYNMKPGETKPAKGEDPITFSRENNPIPVQCSIHNWMSGKIVTFDHPYFAVTKGDGAFEIGHVPLNEELTIYMWHESMDSKKNMGTVTFKDKTAVTKDLEITK